MPRPSSGTARWVCSSSPPSATAPRVSPRPSSERRRRAPSAWSAAATRRPQCASSAFPTTASPTFPPGVGLHWNTLRARRCPASKCWETLEPPEGEVMSRKPLIAGNWKMNLNHFEAIALVQKIAFSLPDKYFDKVDVAVIPPFTDLRSVQTLVDGDKLRLTYGAQDLSQHDSGAYTGEISGAFLAKLGCTFAVVGHSERRTYHQEDDALVAEKVKAAYRHGLTPILCIGEGLEVRRAGEHVAHTLAQLDGGLAGVTAEQAASIVVA